MRITGQKVPSASPVRTASPTTTRVSGLLGRPSDVHRGQINGRNQSWDMDGQGNCETVTTDGTPENRTHNAQNQLTQVGSSTLTFDANGNMTTDEVGRRFRYDAWNRIVGATDAEDNPIIDFAYDALNRRIQELRPSETRDLFYSADWQLLEEQVQEVAVAHYVWSPVYVDALILRDGADSGNPQPVLYALQDANFNVTGIVSTAGVVLERYVQDPYGAATVLTPTWLPQSATQFAWRNYHQGLRFVIDVGLYYNRNRDYSPTLMRFVQVDPVWGPNLYVAHRNAPLDSVDPVGLIVTGKHSSATTTEETKNVQFRIARMFGIKLLGVFKHEYKTDLFSWEVKDTDDGCQVSYTFTIVEGSKVSIDHLVRLANAAASLVPGKVAQTIGQLLQLLNPRDKEKPINPIESHMSFTDSFAKTYSCKCADLDVKDVARDLEFDLTQEANIFQQLQRIEAKGIELLEAKKQVPDDLVRRLESLHWKIRGRNRFLNAIRGRDGN